MAKQRELRDPIHGFIQRSELEEKIINTKVFQRLRGIKQLAMAHLVYPGAMHTRFDHCIGAMQVAGRLADRLLDDPEERRIARLAALLHDIGHGPFSHVSEDILDRHYDQSKVKPKAKEKIHEHITCEIIKKSPELVKLISSHDCEKVTGLLSATSGESIVRGIISGPLDADKQDYLLRDSYFCGVKYGVFDLKRLIGTLQVFPDQYDHILAASRDGVYAIEQFVLAKYHMTTQVYRHKIRLITDAMIVRALELGLEADNLNWLRRLYVYDGSEDYIKNYLEWDDARLTTTLLYPTGPEELATKLFRRLKERNLFKRVFSKPLLEFRDANVREFLSNIGKNESFRKQIEQEIAEYLSSKCREKLERSHVIITTFTIKSVREQSRNNEGSIVIITDEGRPKKFEDESTLFRSIDERQNDQFLEAYAPVTFNDEVDKRRKKEEFSKEIHDILVNAATSMLQDGDKQGDTHDI